MKAILSIALVGLAIAAPYLVPALGIAAAGSFAAIAATAAIEVGIALVSSAILGPSVPKNLSSLSQSHLYATLVTTEPRKAVFGTGPGATDIRYQVYTGAHQEYYHQILCHASHQMDSIDEIWIDNEKAWSATGGVQGRFVNWLTVQTVLLGTSSNGIAIDGVWTSSCTLTGCAYSYIRYQMLNPSSNGSTSPFQSGLSGRITVRCKGALIYDPRLDSTVTGGSGTQRAGSQSTWAWDANGSRNPALQLLWYLLGWKIGALSAPTNGALTQTAAGTLAATTYYVRSTWVNARGETVPSTETSRAVSANNVLNAAAPGSAPAGATGWNVYVSTSTGTETKQNSSPIALGTAWVEPTSGLISGAALPSANTTAGLALGMGLPPARIDLASFITAANHCDESVALAAGGSEPRYRSDGIISEGDDRSTVIENLCSSMNATLRDAGGKIAVQVLVNDLATPVASFNATSAPGDVIGSEEYDQTQPLSNYVNIVRGRRVDPSDNALYQLTDFPQVVLTSPDGIDRIQTVDFPLVQSNGQVQRLAKLRLKRAQYQARYTAAFGSNAWVVSLGNVVTFTHAGMNWASKLFRVVGQAISQNGQVKMTLQEESTDVYSWNAEDVAGTAAGTPTVIDPTKVPSLALVNSGSGAMLGDGIQVPPVVGSGLRYFYNQNPTYTSAAGTPATATISLAAGTLTVGGRTISYNAMSVGVTGTGGTNSTFNLYVDDAAYAGGSATLQATTSNTVPYQGTGRIFMGQVTVSFPSSGSGSGGGTGGGGGGLTCVWSEAFVETMRGPIPASDVLPGDVLRVLTDDRNGTEWHVCEANRSGVEHCYIIRGRDSRIAVTVSQSTPITLRDGSLIAVAEIDGHELPFCAGDDFWWEPCDIESVGMRVVQKITAGAKTYAAGDVAGLSILTHNLKP